MQSHNTGCFKGSRPGSDINRGSWWWPIAIDLASGVDQKLCTIPAETAKPAAYKVRVIISVASDAITSDVLRIGTTSGGTEIINDVSLKGAAGTNYTGTNDFVIVTADQALYIRRTAVGAKTVGAFAVVVEPFEINTALLNTQEA